MEIKKRPGFGGKPLVCPMAGASILLDYTMDHFKKTFLSNEPVLIQPSEYYSNSEWSKEIILNDGLWLVNKGEVEAKSIGGNLPSISLTIGSEFVPKLEGKILFLDDNKIIDFRGVQKIASHFKPSKGRPFSRFNIWTVSKADGNDKKTTY